MASFLLSIVSGSLTAGWMRLKWLREVATQLTIIAQADSPTLFERLSDVERIRVTAALAVILVAAGLLMLFILAAGRITRWYINRKPRSTRLRGDPFKGVLDSKPRPSRTEAKNWQKR